MLAIRRQLILATASPWNEAGLGKGDWERLFLRRGNLLCAPASFRLQNTSINVLSKR